MYSLSITLRTLWNCASFGLLLSSHAQMMKVDEKWDFRSFIRREPLLLVVVQALAVVPVWLL
jgi:hypothetical protein